MWDIPPEAVKFGAAVGKVLSKVFVRPAEALLDNLITAPQEAAAAAKRAKSDSELRLARVITDKAVLALEDLTPQQYSKLRESASQRSLLEELNLQNTVRLALQQLPQETVENQQEPPSDEFLDPFVSIVKDNSAVRMQALFAKILAGEIQKPGSFSKKSLFVAQQLDQSTAELFQCLCSMAFVREKLLMNEWGKLTQVQGEMPFSKIVCSLGGVATNNSLETFGLNFTTLNRLAEYGLVIPSITMRQVFDKSIANERGTVFLPMQYQNRNWGLRKIDGFKMKSNVFMVQGVGFSAIGNELFQVVERIPTPDYDVQLRKFLRSHGFLMVEIAI